jgi:hypothetical protein
MIAWAAVLAIVGGVDLPAREVAADSLSIHGRVADWSSGLPVAFATVRAPQVGRSALTDSEGRFVLRDLPAGPLMIEVQQLGYEPHDLIVNIGPASPGVEIELMPDPVVLEGIVAAVDRFGERTRRIPYDVYAWGEADLAEFGRPSVLAFLDDKRWLDCDIERCMTLVQARRREPFLFIDEIERPWKYLETYNTDELYRVEFIRNCPMVRIYTRAYMERVARGRARLPDSYVADCMDVRRRMGLRLF